MKHTFILFDMDGVLLKHGGYHQALKASVQRIGKMLGAPYAQITTDQIAQFEALSVTNEWDTVAICTALILIQVWRINSSMRLTADPATNPRTLLPEQPNFQEFLDSFDQVGPLPGESAYQKIVNENLWLTPDQRSHLREILCNCRDIYQSLTLPIHQEAVLGSRAFQDNYQRQPKLNVESFLLKYDHPILTPENAFHLRAWMEDTRHHVGILTNRPNGTPPNFVSAPEAELGAKLVGLESIPLLGSGSLNWFAETKCNLPQHTFLKPHPVHALGLIQMCLGHKVTEALSRSVALCHGHASKSSWERLQGATVLIFEDSVKGLESGIAAKSLLDALDLEIHLKLIGVTENSIKKKALLGVADEIIPTINDFSWNRYS